MLLWRKMWNPKWRPRNGCDGRLKAKNLITTIQVILCCLHVSLGFGTKFTWIVVIKNLAFSLPSQQFLAATLGFTSFFTTAFLHFFIAGLFWIRFHFFLQLHAVKLVDYMLVVICLILYREQFEEFYVHTCILKFVYKIPSWSLYWMTLNLPCNCWMMVNLSTWWLLI